MFHQLVVAYTTILPSNRFSGAPGACVKEAQVQWNCPGLFVRERGHETQQQSLYMQVFDDCQDAGAMTFGLLGGPVRRAAFRD